MILVYDIIKWKGGRLIMKLNLTNLQKTKLIEILLIIGTLLAALHTVLDIR